MTGRMTARLLLGGVFSVFFLLGGCADVTCDKICDGCGISGDCKDNCKDDYNDGNSECKGAMRDFADCVDDKGCDESCYDESEDMDDSCFITW